MSQTKNRHEAERWLSTADEDLRAAVVLRDAGSYAQACFFARQSGEKAMKALWRLVDADAWGHSVLRLVMDFPERASLPDLTPGQVYTRDDAERGLVDARALVSGCREWAARHE